MTYVMNSPSINNFWLAGDAPVDRREFHQRLPGYRETPLVTLSNLAQDLSVGSIFVKDESERCLLPAYKILGASWSIYRMIEDASDLSLDRWSTMQDLASHVKERLPSWRGLVAATDGNHGRAVARMGRYIGLPVQILVPAGTRGPRIEAIRSEGASVEVIAGTYDDAVLKAERSGQNGWIVVADTSSDATAEGPRWVIEGYETMVDEVDEQLEAQGIGPPTIVFVPAGVGSLLASVITHYRRSAAKVTFVSVEPTAAACVMESIRAGSRVSVSGPHISIMAGLNCGIPSAVAWETISAGVSVALAVSDEAAVEAMAELYSHDIVSGESGAASLAGLMMYSRLAREIDVLPKLDKSSRVLLLSTEGATDPDSHRIAISRVAGSLG